MLIIFGTRVRLKVVASLVFFCPACGGDRQGTRREARQWFTVFFIPIIPMKRLGEVVQCETCRRTYAPEVLERPTTAALDELLSNAVRALTVMVVIAGDRASVPLRSRAVAAIGAVVAGYTDDTLQTDMAVIDPSQASAYVQPLADGLASSGAERFVGDLARVAVADGPMTDFQRHVIDEAGKGLGLSPAHVLGIVTSVESAARTGPAPDGP